MQKFLIFGWTLSAFLLLAYSFTQVDLSLTLSQLSIWQVIQKSFQQIGYFQRPLSTVLFLTIVGLLFALYLFTLTQIRKKKIERKYLFGIIIAICGILFFSYNAFSYDLFNYIFDAKVFTFYFQNPYFHKAQDFAGDPMLSFMHWTHRVYPYGPIWILFTIPFSFFGLNIFLLTFYLFKSIAVFSFIASAFLIEKIAKRIGVDSLFAVAVFALNPLIIVESLVSAHHDIFMMAIALLALLLFLEDKLLRSAFWLVISAGVKFATVFMWPAFIIKKILNLNNDKFFLILSASMIVALILATWRTTFQPWYLLFVLPFSTFISDKRFVFAPTFIMSVVGLLYYAPFIYLGNWNPPVPSILLSMLAGGISVSIIIAIALSFSGSISRILRKLRLSE